MRCKITNILQRYAFCSFNSRSKHKEIFREREETDIEILSGKFNICVLENQLTQSFLCAKVPRSSLNKKGEAIKKQLA